MAFIAQRFGKSRSTTFGFSMKKLSRSPRTKNTKDQSEIASLELDPDAWPKFESLVKSAAKMGHKPHDAKLKKIAKAKPRGKT